VTGYNAAVILYKLLAHGKHDPSVSGVTTHPS